MNSCQIAETNARRSCNLSLELEKLLGILPEDIGFVVVADFRGLYFFQRGAMLITCRIRVEQTAKDQPMRAHRFDELLDVC